jgi:uncharacterized protein (DUF697 family)
MESETAEQEREQRSRKLIERCGYAAAAITLLPIPGTEIVGVLPLHVGMVIAIGDEYGQKITKDAAVALITRIGATAGLSLVGSAIAMTAGKIILPGLAGLVAAPLMFASTVAIGRVALLHFKSGGRVSTSEMKQAFRREVERAKSIFDPRRARDPKVHEEAAATVREEVSEAAPAAEAASAPPAPDEASRLAKLTELRRQGLITEDEYAQTKARILDSL